MGTLGFPEIVLIVIIALVVFGPKKLPELSRTIGKALAEFRKATGDLRSAMEQEMRELERHTQELEQKSQQQLSAANEPAPVYDPDMETRSIGFTRPIASTNAPASDSPDRSEDVTPQEVIPPDGDNKRS